jgi:HK97 family phage major capsid protein
MKKLQIVLFNILFAGILGMATGKAEVAAGLAMFAGLLSYFVVIPSGSLASGLAARKKGLEEEIGELEKKANGILNKAEAEKRNTSDEENTAFDAVIADIEAKKALLKTTKRQLDFEKSQADAAAAVAGASGNGSDKYTDGDKKDIRKFSMLEAITQASEMKTNERRDFEGIVNDVIKEGRKEMREAGKVASGITIPSSMIQWGSEKRDLTVTTEGTDLVQTTIGGLIPLLRPNPIVQSLGAQMLTGLQGDLQLPRHNAAAAMAWEGENDANAETTPTFDKVDLTPNRVGGFTDLSQKLLRQSSVAMNNWVQNELSTALALEIDSTAIAGLGSGDQPTGILNLAGIGSVAIGTNGGPVTYASIVNTMREVDIDNALMGSVGWLTNPKVKAAMMQISKQASGVEGNFILNDPNNLIGYKIGYSTQVPSNLVKGSSGAVCSALIFGNFADLYIAQWGGVDLIVDPYTQATSGLIRIVINAYMDVQARHPQSFAAIQDLTT